MGGMGVFGISREKWGGFTFGVILLTPMVSGCCSLLFFSF